MLKHLLLVAVLFSAIACSSDKNSSIPSAEPKPQDTALVTVDAAPISADTANVYEFMSGPQGPLSIHIYSEDGIWIIEQNKIAEDGLPTPMGRWTFTTKEKAYAYAVSELGVSETQRNDAALDKDPSSDVLFSDNLSSGNVLWEVKNTWDWDWEIAFAKWMRANLHPDFFEQLGIENDCADAYYQARMIFAYENALPVSFRLAGGGAFFTQNVVRPEWKKLKTNADWRKNERFLKALDYIANTTYTHTLGRDTYPVEITAEGLIEGTAFLYLDKTSGHTLLVNEINLGNTEASKIRLPMYTLNSTVPKSLQPLYEAMFYEPSQPEVSKYGFTGFVRFRWPKSSGAAALVDATKMPYYSMEQYDKSFMDSVTNEGDESEESSEEEYKNFSLTVFKRLNPDFDPTLRITEGITEISEMMIARKDVVIEGYKVCQKGCADGSADYENWSTPSRDKRIKGLLVDLEKYQQALYGIPAVSEAWTKALENPIVELEGSSYSLNHVKWTFANDFHNSNPNVTPGERWGLSPEAFAMAAQKELNPQIEARNAKIKGKNDCQSSPSCLLFSEDYIANSTFIEDQDMQRATLLRNEYCNIAGVELCEKFKSTLATLPTASPVHANFLETWEKIYLLNSDPTVSEAQRWGAMPQGYKTMTLSGLYTVVGKYNSKVVLQKEMYPNAELSIVDDTTEKFEVILKLAKSGTYALNSKNGLLAVIDNATTELIIYDVTTSQKQVLKLFDVGPIDEYGFYASLSWTKSGALLVSYQNKMVAYTLENGQFTTNNQVYKNYAFAGTDGYIYAMSNLELDSEKPPKWEISFVNALDTTKANIQFLASDVLGSIKPSYISFSGMITNKAALLQWNYYDSTVSQFGYIHVDLVTGNVKNMPKLPSYLSRINDNVASTTIYNDSDGSSKTEFYFFTDDFAVEKVVSLKGSCQNCYEETADSIKVGSDMYKIDMVKKEVVKTVSFTGLTANASVDVSAIYGNLAILSYYNDTEYYYALYDLEKQETLITAESLGLNLTVEGILPMLTISKSHTAGPTPETLKYYSLNLLYDLLNIPAGPIATPGNTYYGDEGDGEPLEYAYDEDGNIIVPENEAVKALPKTVPFDVTILDPSVIKTKNDKISIFSVSDYQTVIVFK